MTTIKAVLKRGDKTVSVDFPCRENDLLEKLQQIDAESSLLPTIVIDKITMPTCFGYFEGKRLNLDELNYLAKRMDSFDEKEMSRFYEAVMHREDKSLKDLINLTFNLHKYVLIRDISSPAQVGWDYLLQTEGALPNGDRNDPKYAEVGKDIIKKGYSVFTEHGLFIYNPFAKLDEVYDGTVFPQYMWSDSLIEAEIDYKGKAEFVYLPDDEQAIRKAVERLGAESIDECAIGIESADIYDDKMLEIIEKAINTDGIYAANNLLRKFSETSPEYDKLAAMVEFTDAVHCHDIGVLLDHINDFGFIEGAETNEAVGRFFVENYDEYQVSMALEDYINYDGFGEQMAEEHEGEFISSGFVYYNGSRCLDDILAQFGEPDSTITMGGI